MPVAKTILKGKKRLELPVRKQIRLREFYYSQNGAYFVTICTKDRKCILSEVVGDGLRAVPQIRLSSIGIVVEKSILYINENYKGINIDKYVIMPNHIHMITVLSDNKDFSGGHGNPPLQDLIGYFKSYTTKRYNKILETRNMFLWQRSFYEHIIRNEQDYLETWEYIDVNPEKWLEDKYYEN